MWRTHKARAQYYFKRSCIIRIQRCVQKYCERVMRQRYQEASTKIQTHWRRHLKRIQFIHYKDCAKKKYNIVFESSLVRIALERESATTIQRHMRGMIDRRRTRERAFAVSKLQNWTRMRSKQRAYHEMRLASMQVQSWLRKHWSQREKRVYRKTVKMAKRL